MPNAGKGSGGLVALQPSLLGKLGRSVYPWTDTLRLTMARFYRVANRPWQFPDYVVHLFCCQRKCTQWALIRYRTATSAKLKSLSVAMTFTLLDIRALSTMHSSHALIPQYYHNEREPPEYSTGFPYRANKQTKA